MALWNRDNHGKVSEEPRGPGRKSLSLEETCGSVAKARARTDGTRWQGEFYRSIMYLN